MNPNFTLNFLFSGNNASGLLPSCSHSVSAPRIVTWSPYMMETIGNDVVLPCVSLGTPAPQVYWIDQQNQLIAPGPNESRYKVRSGQHTSL